MMKLFLAFLRKSINMIFNHRLLTHYIISFTRTFAFQAISVVLLPLLFEINGIWWATAVAETLALIISVGFLIKLKNKYGY